jgi:hypothetical protein
MENAAWYTWDDMTPWRFAILGGVILVTLVVIKLVERYGTGVESNEEFFEDFRRIRLESERSTDFSLYYDPSRDD